MSGNDPITSRCGFFLPAVHNLKLFSRFFFFFFQLIKLTKNNGTRVWLLLISGFRRLQRKIHERYDEWTPSSGQDSDSLSLFLVYGLNRILRIHYLTDIRCTTATPSWREICPVFIKIITADKSNVLPYN